MIKIIQWFKMRKVIKHLEKRQITLKYDGNIDVRVNGLILNDGFEIDGFKVSEFDKIYDNRDALLKGLDEELKKDKFFNEDFIKSHEVAKRELENLKDIIEKLSFDLIGKCKELDIDYKDLIARSK